MRYCEFIDEQSTWRCKHCGLTTPKRSDKPPISECSGESPVEVIRQEQQPTTWFRPGTWLAKAIEVGTLGIVKPCCKCNKRKRAMDQWGERVTKQVSG